MKIKLSNNLVISKNFNPFFVAEFSANHNGSNKSLLKNILEAKNAGADLIKIQTYDENDIAYDLSKLKKVKLKNHYKFIKN